MNDAFSVYEIDLCKWFPGNTENVLLPLDMNDDGYLDSADTNWQTDEESYPKGTISLPRGTVFGDSFWGFGCYDAARCGRRNTYFPKCRCLMRKEG